MKVLIACEFSGRVREAFRRQGHDAWSADLLPTEIPGQHIQGDVINLLSPVWDMMIAFPPCTYLANSGNRWHYDSIYRTQALEFVRALLDAPIPRIAIENPAGAIGKHIRKPDDTFQPWMFGHRETKLTCLWLKNLDYLRPTNVVYGPYETRVWNESPSLDRWKKRSRTLPGVADAMASQWGRR